jgi:RNA polymerase sigma factor (sigma-70 family)
MSKEALQQAVDSVRDIIMSTDAAGLADRALLERFLANRDEAAFEALVRRHGPMVLGVARRVLPNASDADDVFQAAFLVLVRKAASVSRPELLGNWLYGVAFHTARAARTAARLRRVKEGQVTARRTDSVSTDWQEILPALDEELNRLPDKYRIPVVLCDLQEKSRKEVAAELGVPEGTLSSRLARGRALLARRLTKRGIGLTAGALAAGWAGQASAAIPAAALVHATVKAGAATLAGEAAAVGLLSTKAIKLSETVIKMMFLSKLKLVSGALVVGAILAAGVGAVAAQRWHPAPGNLADIHDLVVQVDGAAAAKDLLKQTLDAAAAVDDPMAKLMVLVRLAGLQVRMDNKADALTTAGQALQVAQNVANSLEKVHAMTEIASIQEQAGDEPASRATMHTAEQAALALPGFAKGNSILDLVRRWAYWGDYDQCLRLAATAENYKQSALMTMAQVICFVKTERQPKTREALKQAAAMAQKMANPPPVGGPQAIGQVFGAIAAAQVWIGHSDDAMKTLESIPGSQVTLPGDNANGPRSVVKFNALRDVAMQQARAGDSTGARKTIAELHHPFLASSVELAIANQQIASGDFKGALETAKGAGNVPERRTVLKAIARAQIAAGDREGAQSTLIETHGLSQENLAPPSGTPPGAEIHPRVALAAIEALLGEFDAAQKTADSLTTASDKAEALIDLGSQLLAAGKKEEAKRVLRRAGRSADRIEAQANAIRDGMRSAAFDRSGIPPSSEARKRNLLIDIAVQQAKAGDAEGAFETVESLPAGREQGIDRIILALAEGADSKGALESFAKLGTTEERTHVLEGLARIMTRAGDEPGALALAAKQTSPLLKAYALLGAAEGKANLKEPEDE